MTSRSDRSSSSPEGALLAQVHRAEWGRLLALLVARTRRLDRAEDALSEAFARAAERWPTEGAPDDPVAWLYRTAQRQVIGWLRSEAVAARKAPLLAVRADWVMPEDRLDQLPDERLHLILLCCHPALSAPSQCALALRLVLRTPTEAIARLFLVERTAMAARITRAKKKIVAAGIPLSAPVGEELRARLDEVCRTLYLGFTAGYAPGPGPLLLRADVAGEAVRLAEILRGLTSGAPQVDALSALLLLQHSRRDARVVDGRLVLLADQDRQRWHHDEVRRGLALAATLRPTRGHAEALRLQVLVAAEHAKAPAAAATDWAAIARAYAALEALTGSPVVRLNRAVAVAEAEGAAAGLELLDALEESSLGHRLHVVRAELARRAGDLAGARLAYRAAIAGCTNEVERLHLSERFASVGA